MNIIWAFVLLVAGLVMLWKSADILVDGAVGLAKRLGVSALVVGLTVVAMGTSAPEAAASIAAAARNAGDVAIGNVYGSNIANLALVGGLCALIWPIRVQLRVLQRELPVMLIVALLLWPVLHNLHLSRAEGIVLLGIFAALIVLTVHTARKDAGRKPKTTTDVSDEVRKAKKLKVKSLKTCVLFVVIGLVGLALGADMSVRGAMFVGQQIGLSKAVIGLTIIAIGTSLPELATCVAASLKKQDDISIGIMVGSNIFNALLAIGVAGLVRPFALSQRLIGVDYWVMVIVSAGFSCAALVGRRVIGRTSGAVLLCGYVAYIVYLLAFSG